MINREAARAPAPALHGASTGEATFNFEGESVHAVVKAILGHGHPGHAQAGVTGTGVEPAGNGAGLEQRAHGVQRRPLQHRRRRPGAGRNRCAQHRAGGQRARLRSAGDPAAVHLRQRDEEAAAT
ncbi:hypothetical protein G6F65_020924 [Rhizopus arrhizus]|nr:hypothetical protein G6F65_020924 [Rhizopus arrhizus]